MSLPAEEFISTTPTVSPARVGGIGLGIIALSITRGWTDGLHFARYASVFGRRLIDSPASVPWSEFSGIAWAAWPILLGILLLKRRSPKLLGAASLTCLALSMERLVSLVVGGVFDSGWSTLYQGGYDRSLGPVLPRGTKLIGAIATAGAWLILAFVCFVSAPRRPLGVETFQEKRARRKASARMTNAGSILFATSIFAMIGWTTYITVLERLPWVRTLVISGDRRKARQRRPYVETAQDRKYRDAERLLNEAQGLSRNHKYLEARRSFIRASNRLEDLMDEYPDQRFYRRQFALAANNLAWFLATCEDETVRDGESAVVMAKKAVTAIPGDGNSLNTLAVAQFRAGEFDSAAESFAKSMKLREGGDSFDWYFLAQIEMNRNHPKVAKEWYDRAVVWGESYRANDLELFRFQTETAEKLGLPKPVSKVVVDPLAPVVDQPVFLGPAGMLRRLQ